MGYLNNSCNLTLYWFVPISSVGFAIEVDFCTFEFQLVIIKLDIASSCCLQQCSEGQVGVFMVVIFPDNHDIICNYYQIFNMAKTFVQLSLEYISSDHDAKWHDSKSESSYLSIEIVRYEEVLSSV